MRPLISASFITLLCAVLSACGNSSGSLNSYNQAENDEEDYSDEEPVVLEGWFVESAAVQGLHYATATQQGVTSDTGKFYYLRGEKITFQFDDFLLGSAATKTIVTPLDLVAEAIIPANSSVVNMSRLLQSLDSNGDLANGIQLNTNAASANPKNLPFEKSAEAFENDDNVVRLLSQAGNTTNLIAPLTALENFKLSLNALGKWTGNKAPVVSIVPGFLPMPVGAVVNLVGSVKDTDSASVSTQWHREFGSEVGLLVSSSTTASFVVPDQEGFNLFIFKLEAMDELGARDSAVAIILALPKANEPPKVSASEDQTVYPWDTVILTGDTTKTDVPIKQVGWLQVSGNKIKPKLRWGRERVTFVAPEVDKETQYGFVFIAEDHEGNVVGEEVAITVLPSPDAEDADDAETDISTQ